MPFYRLIRNLLPLLLLSACATVPTPPLDYRPGAVVETLSSAVSLSIHAAESRMSGSGYLLFRRPDQLHLIVLSPFGTTLMEAFALGDRITLVYPSRATAYVGNFNELPEKGGLQGWRLMRWVMDADPADPSGVLPLSGTVERVSKTGSSEKVTYENGLVAAKESSAGDQIQYRNYAVVNGVPLAGELDLRNDRGDRIRIVLDEPEVNTVLDDAVFTPQLDGLTIIPLSAIQGL
ncbi:MAG: lipoprotein insertase outer membrane protein LolB [Desulfuromonadaceae bacterium]